jgi:hypothetical protein
MIRALEVTSDRSLGRDYLARSVSRRSAAKCAARVIDVGIELSPRFEMCRETRGDHSLSQQKIIYDQ